ncbi:MAG: C2 family cysteine protease [Isosphaeraceae bacterium]
MFSTFHSHSDRSPFGRSRFGRNAPFRKQSRRAKLSVESLEGRVVPSGFVVSSPLDLPNTPGTLRDAIDQANAEGQEGISSTITFTPSMNGDHIFLALGDLELTAGASVTIWGYSQITLNGDGTSIFKVDAGASLNLYGLTLAGGEANSSEGGNGGAIDNAGILEVNGCDFTVDSASGLGGAIYNSGTLEEGEPSTFIDNTASAGGAIANAQNAAATVQGDAITGNSATAGSGGGLYNDGAMTVAFCTLSGNTATAYGGGLDNDLNGTLTLIGSTLAKNSALAGGGAANSGTMTLSATTAAANSAVLGGGVWNLNSLSLDDTIVAADTLASASGSDPDIDGSVTATSDHNLVGNGSGVSGITNGVNSNQIGSKSSPINPMLYPLASYGSAIETMPPEPGSPALAKGGPLTTLTAPIGQDDTTIPVADAAAIASTAGIFGIQVDSEQMTLTGVDLAANTLTVIRGPGGLEPAMAHNAGAGIVMYQNYGVTASTSPALGAIQPGPGMSPAVKLIVSGPTGQSVQAAAGFTVTITAEDGFDNTATEYNGSVTLKTSEGSDFTVPLTNGVGTITIGMDKAGTGETLTATDGSISGTSASFTVTGGAATTLSVTAPTSIRAGAHFTVTVTAADAFGNPATGYVSLAHGLLETVAALSNGQAQFPETLDGAGTVQFDAYAASGATALANVTVTPGPESTFQVVVPSAVTAGVPFNVSVTAVDAYGNTATSYDNSLNFACSDVQAIYPASHGGATGVVITAGKGSAQIALHKADTLTLELESITYRVNTKTPVITVLATSNHFTVGPGNAASYAFRAPTTTPVGAPFTFTFTARDQFGNTDVNYDALTTVAFEGNQAESLLNGNSGYAYVHPVKGVGSVTVTPETLGPLVLNVTDDTIDTASHAITVTPDWFSNNIPDPGIQALARTDFYSNSPPSITYDDMLGLFAQAESETLSTNTNEALYSLGKLVADGQNKNVRMPLYLEELSNTVLNFSPGDVTFLAGYYTTYPTAGIPVTTIKGVPYFGYSSDPAGVSMAAMTRALVNQWLLGSVHPDDAVSAALDDNNGVAEAPYSVPSGTLSLYGPSGLPEASDVQQGLVGDCWLVAGLADVAYEYPGMIQSMFIPHDNGTYTVRIYGGNPWGAEYVTVDDQLPNGGNTFDSPYVGGPNGFTIMWAALAEKAFAEVYGPGSNYAYAYLDGSGPNRSSGGGQYSIHAITNLATGDHGFGGLGDPKASDVAFDLSPTRSMPQGQLVCLGTKNNNVSPPLDTSHEYAVLCYDSSTGNFLLYNPWGLTPAAQLALNVTSTTTNQIQLFSDPQVGSNPGSIAAGDVIQIDQEDMYVQSVSGNTLTVIRGFYNTTPAIHTEAQEGGSPVGVYLVLGQLQTSGPPVYGPWTQLEPQQNNAPIATSGGALPLLGLFTGSESFLNHNFDALDNTNGSAPPAANGGPTIVNIGMAGLAPSVQVNGSRRFLEGSLTALGVPAPSASDTAVPLGVVSLSPGQVPLGTKREVHTYAVAARKYRPGGYASPSQVSWRARNVLAIADDLALDVSHATLSRFGVKK